MIIQQFIQIRSHHRNQKWFKDKGYNVPKSYDFFTVKTCDLPKCCRLKIECQCDFCGETFFRPFCKISGDKQSCGKKKCKLELQKETMMEHFNVPFGVQCPEIRKKMEKTRIKKTGYFSPVVNPQNKEKHAIKRAETKYRHNSVKTSKNQIYLHQLLGGELNYNIYTYNVDIAFLNEKIALEYDGWFHLNNVHHKESNDNQRDEKIISLGWKVIRFQCYDDILPSDEKILQLFEQAKKSLNKKIVIDLKKYLL